MIKLTPTLEAEAARLAALHGWPLDVVRGFALGRMLDAKVGGADEPCGEQLALRDLEYDLIWTLDPDPPCDFCGDLVPGASPSKEGDPISCDECQRRAERIPIIEAGPMRH